MQVGDHTSDRELPFETDAQIHHDADHDHQQGHQAIFDELAAYLRANELHPAELDIWFGSLQCRQHDFALHGRRFIFAYRQADHDIARGAKVLYLEVGIAQLGHGISDIFELCRLRIVDLHDGTAGELD